MNINFVKGIKFKPFDICELIFPSRCGACGRVLVRHERKLCTLCYRALPRTHSHKWKSELLEQKMYGRIPVNTMLACLEFSRHSLTRELVHHIKYEGRIDLAYELGLMYANELKKDNYKLAADTLVPVPVHWRRRWKRGYNQAEAFANGLGAVLGIPVDTKLLIRMNLTQTQTAKTRYERWAVLENQFRVNKPERLSCRRVIMVDDVITTGSTLDSCVRTLYENNVLSAGIIALAVVR